MDEWRARLRTIVAGWGLSPEDQLEIVDELTQHLEEQLAELTPRIGAAAARERIFAQIEDPALRAATIRPRHRPPPSVEASRRGGAGWESLARDIRYGWRSLFTSPATTAMATIALALGIGLATVMFSIIYGFLLRGLPFEDGNRIAIVGRVAAANGMDEPVSLHEYFAYAATQRSFESFGAYSLTTINLSGDDRPERVNGARVTPNLLDVTRTRPALGRSFRNEDAMPDGASVIMLSHSLWRDHYASDTSVVGRAVRVNGQPATVIGVMPEGFAFPNARVWLPLRVNPAAISWGTGPSVQVAGRLRPGVTFEEATAELITLAQRLEAEHPQTNKGVRAVAQPFVRAVIRSQIFSLMYAMFGAVALVFLVACTNVANLLLARAAHRAREVSIRVALGASRVAIARQFLVEAFVLSLVSAALGAMIAQIGVVLFRSSIADLDIPFFADVRLHPQVFAFIALAAFVASIVAGLLPALRAARSDASDVLKDQSLGSSSYRSGRLSRALVVFELVLSSALLIVAALLTKTVLNLRNVDPGFRSNAVLTARVTLTPREPAQRAAFFARLEEEASRLPGAVSVTLGTNIPGIGWGGARVAVEGRTHARDGVQPRVRQLSVSPGFFDTFDVAVNHGRAFTAGDRREMLPVAVVNQRFVADHFRGDDPIGRRIKLNPTDSTAPWLTIVGVMPNLYSAGLGEPWPAEVLSVFEQTSQSSASISIHVAGDPTALAQPLRKLAAGLDADLPVYAIKPMDRVLREAMWPTQVFGGLFIVFGIVALALASIGLYAVLAFSVSRREREIGIRMALGAATGDVLRLVFRDGAVQLAVGTFVGVLLGVAGARLGRAVFFQVEPGDPTMIAAVVAVLAITGFAACVGPALRATKSDPVRSLRAE